MSKQEFISNFRIAEEFLFFHPRVEADSAQFDTQAVAQKLALALAIWLTPRSVRGFNAAEFPELGPDRRRELEQAVQAFLEVASQVPAKEPATLEQYDNGKAAFAKLLEILEPYLAISDEEATVARILKTLEFPSWSVNWDFELRSDWVGDPAVTVTLYADEFTPANRMEVARSSHYKWPKRFSGLSDNRVKRWPYTHVQTAAEHKSM